MSKITTAEVPTSAQYPVHGNADLRILHRVDTLDCFPRTLTGKLPHMTVAVLDVETTGLAADLDEVIEIAAVLLRIDAFGRVVEVLDSAQSLRDPGRAIPAEIERITGISDKMVADIQFNPAPFLSILEQAEVIIAHNAEFDARFVERLLPQISGWPWACSLRQFDWRGAGFDGGALGYLLMQTGRFNTGHRALDDVISLIHILAQEPDGVGTIMSSVIKTASEDAVRVEATGAVFEMRTILKAEGYRWDADRKVWWKEVPCALAPVEVGWLREQVISARFLPRTCPVTWRNRFR